MPSPIIINDETWQQVMPNRFPPDGTKVHDFGGHSRILNAIPPLAAPGECEGIPGVTADDFQLIPRDQWDDLIADMDRNKAWLEDRVRDVIPCTDQDGLGYCHAYGTIAIAEVQRELQGHEFVPLSAESIGGPITNWRNRGADPTRDIQQMSEYGACPKSMMDREWSLNPSRWDPTWKEARLKYRVSEWRDMRTTRKMFDAAATMALRGIPGGVGYSWWSHYISGPYRLLKEGGRYALRNRNNWGADYGDNGFLDMVEGRGTPDWLFAAGFMHPYDAQFATAS